MAERNRLGVIPFSSGLQSPAFLITNKNTLGRLQLRITGELNVTIAATLREDGVLRLLRRISIEIGGEPIKTIGDGSALASAGKLLHFMNRLQYGSRSAVTQPAVGVGVNPFSFLLTIPFEMPPNLSRDWPDRSRFATALSPTSDDVDVIATWGTVADVIASGTASLQQVEAEVVAVTHPDLDVIPMPLLLKETTQQVQITAGANPGDEQPLNKSGLLPYLFLFAFDNDLRNNSQFNSLDFLLNSKVSKLRQSFDGLRDSARSNLGLDTDLDVGVNLALFDEDQNGDGTINLSDPRIASWRLETDHAALTAPFRLIAHHYHMEQQQARIVPG